MLLQGKRGSRGPGRYLYVATSGLRTSAYMKLRDEPSYRCETVMAISTSFRGWILPSKSRMKCWYSEI